MLTLLRCFEPLALKTRKALRVGGGVAIFMVVQDSRDRKLKFINYKITKLNTKNLHLNHFDQMFFVQIKWFKTRLNHKPFLEVKPVESDLRSVGLICYICEPGYTCVPVVPQYTWYTVLSFSANTEPVATVHKGNAKTQSWQVGGATGARRRSAKMDSVAEYCWTGGTTEFGPVGARTKHSVCDARALSRRCASRPCSVS